tara:strand:- start:691 stop:1041 length:351 start_codon:yes stop_codon:yes gene_type:complete
MILDAGKKAVANLIKASGEFEYMDIGDGGDDTSTSQTTLDSSVLAARKLVAPTLVGNTLIYEVSFTGTELASNVVSEIGIFDASTGGNMLSRVKFNTIGPLASNETISFTLRLEVE